MYSFLQPSWRNYLNCFILKKNRLLALRKQTKEQEQKLCNVQF